MALEDEAGNLFTGDRTGLDDLVALDLQEILGCTIKGSSEGLLDGPPGGPGPREPPVEGPVDGPRVAAWSRR